MKDDEPIEAAPNIGRELGKRLRAVGIETVDRLAGAGDEEAFARLAARFPDDACSHTRLALAGAVRGVRWMKLPKELRERLTRSLR